MMTSDSKCTSTSRMMAIVDILNTDESNTHPQNRPSQSTVRGPERRREPRRPYDQEEEHFIFYHRNGLNWDWRDIKHAYNM